MPEISFQKATGLPGTLTPNQVYYLKVGDEVHCYVADQTGTNAYRLIGAADSSPIVTIGNPANSETSLNLSLGTVFKLNTSSYTGQLIELVISNAPANRAQTFIIDVIGNQCTLQWPTTNFQVNDDVVMDLATTHTVFVVFWNGTTSLVTSAIKVA